MTRVAGVVLEDVAGNAYVQRIGRPARVAVRTTEQEVVGRRRVALRTRHRVIELEREPRMTEGSTGPVRIAVAVTRIADRVEPRADVIRIAGAVVILQVAAHAGRRRSRKLVVDVTHRARRGVVDAHQREDGIVIEPGAASAATTTSAPAAVVPRGIG